MKVSSKSELLLLLHQIILKGTIPSMLWWLSFNFQPTSIKGIYISFFLCYYWFYLKKLFSLHGASHPDVASKHWEENQYILA